jgi:hypothetical protein
MVSLLAAGRGLEVHACGFVDHRGNGHLLLGQSGAGKTTMARLLESLPGVTILSDDRIVLRKKGEQYLIYGTPWHGEARFSSPASARLSRMLLLRHGPKNELASVRQTNAAARLFACSFVPFYDPGGLDFSLCFCDEVTKAVPCFEFRFVPNESAVEFLRQRYS